MRDAVDRGRIRTIHLPERHPVRGKTVRMVRIEDSILIDRPAQQVWGFISDHRNNAKWYDGDVKVRQTSAGPLSVGTTFESAVRWRGRPLALRVRCALLDPGQKIAWEYTSGPTQGSRDAWRVEAVDDNSTRLTRWFDLETAGGWRLIQPIIARGARRAHRAEIATIKRVLEGERQADA